MPVTSAKKPQILPRSAFSAGEATVDTTWQREIARAVRDPAELLGLLDLPLELLEEATRAARLFPLRVPHPFLRRIRPGNPQDPLLRQVLPLGAEQDSVSGYTKDPLLESAANPTPGLLHKYSGRVLFVASPNCAIHCRYCFRRHFPYDSTVSSGQPWRRTLSYVTARPDITEFILSGGDPLSLGDDRLSRLIDDLERIKHLKLLRIHSRLPIAVPNRVTSALVERLRRSRLKVTLVVHANHANELDDQVAQALDRLADARVALLNQSVLLRGVNDSADALAALSLALHEAGVIPYYLHLPDKVAGTAHFDVSEDKGRALVRRIRGKLPGYLVPRLVRETPGEQGKTIIT